MTQKAKLVSLASVMVDGILETICSDFLQWRRFENTQAGTTWLKIFTSLKHTVMVKEVKAFAGSKVDPS